MGGRSVKLFFRSITSVLNIPIASVKCQSKIVITELMNYQLHNETQQVILVN